MQEFHLVFPESDRDRRFLRKKLHLGCRVLGRWVADLGRGGREEGDGGGVVSHPRFVGQRVISLGGGIRIIPTTLNLPHRPPQLRLALGPVREEPELRVAELQLFGVEVDLGAADVYLDEQFQGAGEGERVQIRLQGDVVGDGNDVGGEELADEIVGGHFGSGFRWMSWMSQLSVG